MDKKEKVFTQVNALYQKSQLSVGRWLWANHVQWVADRAKVLAIKYNADVEKTYCAALLHDLADCQFERSYEDFDKWSEEKGRVILMNVDFSEADTKEIIEVIIRPHSCRLDNLPKTIEGKVLATADALFHLQTSFFPMFCYKRRPIKANNYEEWQTWFNEKIARDFYIKIFFADEREEARVDYEALVKVFGNKTLNSSESLGFY